MQVRSQQVVAFDVVRSHLQREVVACRIEHQAQRRAIGHLQTLRNGIGHGGKAANLHIEHREVVRGPLALFAHRAAYALLTQKGQVAPCRALQVIEDLAITRLRAERGIHKVGVQLDMLVVGRILASQHHITRRHQAVVVAVADIREGQKPFKSSNERPPALAVRRAESSEIESRWLKWSFARSTRSRSAVKS